MTEEKNIQPYPEYSLNPYMAVVLGWQNKWKLILGSVAGIIILASLFFLTPKHYEANLKLQAPLNGTIKDLDLFESWEISSTNEKDLFNEFLYELTRTDLLINGVKIFDLVDKTDLTDKEYESLVLDFANSINLSFHFDEDAELLNYYLLNIAGSDKKQIRALVEWMIESANETVSNNFNVRLTQTLDRLDAITQLHIEQLSSEIIETKNFHQAQIDDDILEINHEIDEIKQKDSKELEDDIEALNNQILAVINKYEYDSYDDVQYLSEQLSVSKLLGITEPLLMRTELQGNGVNTIINNVNDPDYYRGSIALTELIYNIENRLETNSFTPGLRELEKELLILESQRGKEEYIEGLRELQRRLSLLEKKRDPNFATDLRQKESQLRLLQQNIANDYVRNLYETSDVYLGEVYYVITDHRSLIIRNTKLSIHIYLLAGLFTGLFTSSLYIFIRSITQRRSPASNKY